MNTETRYHRSPYLLLEWGDNGRINVIHVTSSRQYRLDPLVVALLNSMSQPKTVAELATAVPLLANQLPGLIAKLTSTGLIQTEEAASQEKPDSAEQLWSPYELAMHIQASSGTVRNPLPSWPAPDAHEEIISAHRLSLSFQAPYPGNLTVDEALHQRRSIRHYSENAIMVKELGIFLTTSARAIEFIGPRRHQVTHRPSPSAGGRHSLELYVLCRNVSGLSPAVYYFDPFNDELIKLEPWNSDHESLLDRLICRPAKLTRPPDIALYITSVVERVFWKYERSGLSLIYRDTGCLLQTMYLVATDLALAPCAIAAIDRPPLPSFVHRDPLKEIHVGSFALGRPALLSEQNIQHEIEYGIEV